MISVTKPTDLTDSSEYYAKTVYRMQDVNKVFFQITDKNLKGFTIEDSQRYINFTLVNYLNKFDSNGEKTVDKVSYPMKNCELSDFSKTQHEKDFHRTYISE